MEQLEQSETWKELEAVQNNRIHKVDYYDLFFDDPIAIEHQLKMLTDLIVQQINSYQYTNPLVKHS